MDNIEYEFQIHKEMSNNEPINKVGHFQIFKEKIIATSQLGIKIHKYKDKIISIWAGGIGAPILSLCLCFLFSNLTFLPIFLTILFSFSLGTLLTALGLDIFHKFINSEGEQSFFGLFNEFKKLNNEYSVNYWDAQNMLKNIGIQQETIQYLNIINTDLNLDNHLDSLIDYLSKKDYENAQNLIISNISNWEEQHQLVNEKTINMDPLNNIMADNYQPNMEKNLNIKLML